MFIFSPGVVESLRKKSFLGVSHRFSRQEFYEALKEKGVLKPTSKTSLSVLWDVVTQFLDAKSLSHDENKSVETQLRSFSIVLYRKWKKSNFSLKHFRKYNQSWLEGILLVTGSSSLTGGRPKVSFQSASVRTKQRLVKPLIEDHSKEELGFATTMSFRASGSRDAALIVQTLAETPSKGTQLKKSLNDSSSQLGQFSPEEALALFIDLKLTQAQYQLLRNALKSKGLKDVLPSYKNIFAAKTKCYPNGMAISEKVSEVNLQFLLSHTSRRLTESQKEVLSSFASDCGDSPIKLKMYVKWGADGSGGKNSFKQNFEFEVCDDTSILTTCIVPLRLTLEKNEQTVFWKNPRVSSTRYCRPLRVQYIKETDDVIKEEFSKVQKEIDNLTSTEMFVDKKKYVVQYVMFSTMVDGKVCNALMDCSSQKCYICGAGPKDFNNLENKFVLKNISALNFGLSPLHAYIRSFECFLHIAYRLDFCIWRTTKEMKPLFDERKKNIITMFRKETGLLVDVPKQGFGSSNDGNTARRFFYDPQTSSEITGVDKKLIYRFSVILRALNSDYQVDLEKFKYYALETAQLYVTLYPWYPMPPSIHKLLMHSSEVIEHFLLPIGELSEDAQEARHKEVNCFRDHHTRKISRTKTMEDIFHTLLTTSDPFISGLRNLPLKKKSNY